MKRRNRYLSLLLCLSMFFSMIVHSIPAVMAAEKSVESTLEGQRIENLTLEQTNKEILSEAAAWDDPAIFFEGSEHDYGICHYNRKIP